MVDTNSLTDENHLVDVNLSIEEFDVSEFEIPPVKITQTLESILNEPENTSLLEEDYSTNQLSVPFGANDFADVISVSSFESFEKPRKIKKDVRSFSHGSILRHVLLKGVSSQIISASDRVDAGMSTCLAVSSLIAIGTSHGLVLVFDSGQVLKLCLGSTVVGVQYGAVSALSFNHDSTRLLVGFAKGQIMMWDVTNGKLLRTITDAHPPGTAILHIKFTDDHTLAVCNDSGGSVFELEFKRLIGVRTCESRCLFSGSRGEVCAIEPLHINHTITDHPIRDLHLLAMATLSKILIVTLRPSLRVLFTHPLRGDPSTLPLLAWQLVVIQVSEKTRVIDPVLAFARDQFIYFYQVVSLPTGNNDIRFSLLQETHLAYKILAITWSNSRTLVVIDDSEKAHLIDVRTEENLEVIDLSGISIVYNTTIYKSLATGGNVSKALAYAGERACYQSIANYNSQIIILGTNSLHVMTMRTWKERIELLVRQERFQEAMSLCLSFYEGRGRAVIGLSGSNKKRKTVLSQMIFDLLEKFVDSSMTKFLPSHGTMEELESYYQDVIPVCVDFCLILNRTDMLFDKLFTRFSDDPIAKATFLECLEPYILDDKLTSVTPLVMQEFVGHYESRGMLSSVELCIVHLDIVSLDIHQVVSMCWSHALYDAILYIYNNGMQDYTTPLEELFTLLSNALQTGKQLSDIQVKLGNKILVYISCCLSGRAYPLGDIKAEIVEKVKQDVFQCMINIHSSASIEGEPSYPHIKTLLHFGTQEFFNVLALAFQENYFKSLKGLADRQRIINILLEIMIESVEFTPNQVGILFIFIARQLSLHQENQISVDSIVFKQILEYLSQPPDSQQSKSELPSNVPSLSYTGGISGHEERQQVILQLFTSDALSQFSTNELIILGERACFYRFCELLYNEKGDLSLVLSCYRRDPARCSRAFDYASLVAADSNVTNEQIEKIQMELIKNINEYVRIDNVQTAFLILEFFPDILSPAVSELAEDESTLYELLSGIYQNSNTSAKVEPEISERYIELMCKNDPNLVESHLKSTEGYRLDETLELCRHYGLPGPTAYLHEKAGNIEAAFSILLEDFQNKIHSFTSAIIPELDLEKTTNELSVMWSAVEATSLLVVQLCQRNSDKTTESQRENLWFPLLDTAMKPQRKVRNHMNQMQLEAYDQLTRYILNSMLGYISLPAVLQKLMQDPSYSSGRFLDIKNLVLGMLDTYNYEKILLDCCNNLSQIDCFNQLSLLTRTSMNAVSPKILTCTLCLKSLLHHFISDQTLCFRCNHAYHLNCLYTTGSCHVVDGEEIWSCYNCDTKRSHNHRTSRSLSRVQRISSINTSNTLKSQHSSDTKHDNTLNIQHIQSVDNLRKVQRTVSKLGILHELSKQSEKSSKTKISESSISQNERFQLQLASPSLSQI